MNAAPGPVTEDRLLGGRVVLRQPEDGFRAAIDPVLLAAAVPAEPGQSILDLGIGTGAAALCLARRVPGCRVIGIDIQRDLVHLANDNAALNGLGDRVSAMVGDVASLPPRLAPASFDHVMANPPYVAAGMGTLPPAASRATAMAEGEADLARWIRAALVMVRSRGSISFIHRADRLDALIAGLAGRAGRVVVHPFWPGLGKPARRVLVQALRDAATPLSLVQGMVLHEADGRFTPTAEAVLRDGGAIPL
jgi:tRNA1(Val) A37 N6-methylase TrmN6